MEKHAAVAAGKTRCACGKLATNLDGETAVCADCLKKSKDLVKKAGATRLQTLEEQQRQEK